MGSLQRALLQRLKEMVAEEEGRPVDQGLLDALNEFAQRETIYWQMDDAGQRNALNSFFDQLEGLVLNEICSGRYGGSVLLQTALITAFEVGYWTGNNMLLSNVTTKIPDTDSPD